MMLSPVWQLLRVGLFSSHLLVVYLWCKVKLNLFPNAGGAAWQTLS
jgi:hypothetical protein